MKATDLMIGDWVVVHARVDKIAKIEAIDLQGVKTSIGGPWMFDEIEPIPLTPEILEKNGWKTTDRYRYNCGGVWFDIINRGAEDFDIEVSAYDGGFAYVATIYNVHELQHALRLCGIKKEIEL